MCLKTFENISFRMLKWKRPQNFFEECLRTVYRKRHLKQGSGVEDPSDWEEEVTGRLCKGQWGKTAKQLLEEDVFQRDVDLCLLSIFIFFLLCFQ